VEGASWWEKVGSSRRVVSPGELSEPLNGDKVVSLKRVVSPGETLRPRMMMSSGIGCNTVGRGEWGSLDNIGLPFP
jgi:hypothetical protein